MKRSAARKGLIVLLVLLAAAFLICLRQYAIEAGTLTGTAGEAATNQVDVCYAVNFEGNEHRLDELYVSLNSLLYFASCHVKFHFIVKNDLTKDLVNSLFVGNSLNGSSRLFYLDPPFQMENGFRSPFAVTKLFVDSILPISIKNVILLDFDTLLAEDVFLLFKQFDKFPEQAMIGASVEQCDYYNTVGTMYGFPIPNDFKVRSLRSFGSDWSGLNSAVQFLSLDKMRRYNWTQKVMDLIGKFGINAFPLVDQDILNFLGKSDEEIIYLLPLTYNWQHPEQCYQLPGNTSIFHMVGLQVKKGSIPSFTSMAFDLFGQSQSEPDIDLRRQEFAKSDKRTWCANDGSVIPVGHQTLREVKSKDRCIYFSTDVGAWGFTNKLTILAAANFLKRHKYNICGVFWADSPGQVNPKDDRRHLAPPPIDFPYLLNKPPGCSVWHPQLYALKEVTAEIHEQLVNFEGDCLIVRDAVVFFDSDDWEDSHFRSNLVKPSWIPEFDACVHIQNEPDWPESWGRLTEGQVKDYAMDHPKLLLVGDPKYISDNLIANHNHISMLSGDGSALLNFCACKGKAFLGTEMSSLSVLMCKFSSNCTMIMEGKHEPRSTYEQYLKISIDCL